MVKKLKSFLLFFKTNKWQLIMMSIFLVLIFMFSPFCILFKSDDYLTRIDWSNFWLEPKLASRLIDLLSNLYIPIIFFTMPVITLCVSILIGFNSRVALLDDFTMRYVETGKKNSLFLYAWLCEISIIPPALVLSILIHLTIGSIMGIGYSLHIKIDSLYIAIEYMLITAVASFLTLRTPFFKKRIMNHIKEINI